MKKTLILLFVAASLLSACGEKKTEETTSIDANATAAGDAYQLAANSKLNWTGTKLGGEHFGTLTISSGELFAENGSLTGGNFTIDMNSIVVEDLTDPGKNADLTDHLKSDDFFSVEKNPTASFQIKGIAALDSADGNGNTHTVSGTLTIKGIANDIQFPALVSIADNQVNTKAEFKIDRTLWDIRFKSGKFFPELGDKVISDEIGIRFDLTATK